MTSSLLTFIAGAVIGAGALFTGMWIYARTMPGNELAFMGMGAGEMVEQEREHSPTPSPQTNAPVRPESETRTGLDRFSELRSELYREGVRIEATVMNIYEGSGFTVEDDEGTQMFIEWPNEMPPEGSMVGIEGTVSRVSDPQAQQRLRVRSPDLQRFLADNPTFVQARRVAILREPTPTPEPTLVPPQGSPSPSPAPQ